MSRNSGGTYSLPNPPFVAGTKIEAEPMNEDLSDVGTALTDSLDRNGKGGMLAPIRGVAGSLSAPAWSFTADTNTGFYQNTADQITLVCGGAAVALFTTTGITFNAPIAVSGLVPVGLGPLPWSGTSAPTGWVFTNQTLSRTTYASLWAFASTEIGLGNTFYGVGDGSSTFTIGSTVGRVVAGLDTGAAITPGLTAIGATTGAATHTLTTPQIPVTTPTGAVNITDPGHRHFLVAAVSSATGTPIDPTHVLANGYVAGSDFSYVLTQNTASTSPSDAVNGMSSNSTTGVTAAFVGAAFGSGSSHPNVQPSIAFKMIVFAGV